MTNTDDRRSAWMPNTDLTPLETSAIDTTDTKGISKPLAAAYIKALEANDLQSYKDMLAGYQREEQEAQAERDAKKSAKSKRKRFDASATPADDDTDETDTDEDESQFKKRKKDVDNNAEEIVILPGFVYPYDLIRFYSLQRLRRRPQN